MTDSQCHLLRGYAPAITPLPLIVRSRHITDREGMTAQIPGERPDGRSVNLVRTLRLVQNVALHFRAVDNIVLTHLQIHGVRHCTRYP